MSVVLMYHALYKGTDTSAIDQEDLPYAVGETEFTAQLDLLLSKKVGLFESNQLPDIVITFDDGHQSNLDIAAPLLQARGMSACFFITSDFIDQRPGFMSSKQLHRLGQTPGMSIGSHGVSHRFFDDLSEENARAEMVDSRAKLESITGRKCQSISFPGGRFDEQALQLLQPAGYLQWFGSAVGTVDASQSLDTSAALGEEGGEFFLQPQLQQAPINRVAVRSTTSLEEFARMIGPDEHYFRYHRRRSQVKSLGRRFLGNRLYHGLYKILSAR